MKRSFWRFVLSRLAVVAVFFLIAGYFWKVSQDPGRFFIDSSGDFWVAVVFFTIGAMIGLYSLGSAKEQWDELQHFLRLERAKQHF
ncbi:hypothetical protein C4553_02760 [Candidatus Parcubacteria bacterium]|nr:MAG: hypothetical protein C4553_02760 [Candidatus Parcubacteria bacterium]